MLLQVPTSANVTVFNPAPGGGEAVGLGVVIAAPAISWASPASIAIQSPGGGGSGYSAPVLDMALTASGAVPTRRSTWGQVKARYQNGPGMTVTPGRGNQ